MDDEVRVTIEMVLRNGSRSSGTSSATENVEMPDFLKDHIDSIIDDTLRKELMLDTGNVI